MKNDKHSQPTAKKNAPRAEEQPRPQEQPRPEIPTTPRVSEIPDRPSRETAQHDPERAENEGMKPPPAQPAPTGMGSGALEGEGSYTATHRYQQGLERSVQHGDSEQLAAKAAKALDGPEGEELREAERDAKQGHSSHPHAHAHKKAS
jgi:hypothetical protein